MKPFHVFAFDEPMVFQNTFDAQDTPENISKPPRTVLFKEREDDEPMAS